MRVNSGVRQSGAFVRTLVTMLFLLLICDSSAAQDRPSKQLSQEEAKAEMCSKVECQRDVRVVIRQTDGKVFDRKFDVLSTTVQGKSIFVFTGQTIRLAADVAGSQLTNIRLATVGDTNIIEVRLSQDSDTGYMTLKVSNPFDAPLKFDLGMMPLSTPRLFKTSSCPIAPKGAAFETWPHPIFQIVLANGRFLSNTDPISCS